MASVIRVRTTTSGSLLCEHCSVSKETTFPLGPGAQCVGPGVRCDLEITFSSDEVISPDLLANAALRCTLTPQNLSLTLTLTRH
jgi:hypothetical protein